MRKPKPDEVYKHYKGGIYTVVDIGIHSETMEEMVVYRTAGGVLFVRPLSMWFEEIPGMAAERFTLIKT